MNGSQTISGNNGITEGLIQSAYESLKNGEGEAALGSLKTALKTDFEHQEVLYALKCLNWWLEKIQLLDNFRDPYEQGGFILSQWESYHVFLDRLVGQTPNRVEPNLNRGNKLLPNNEAVDSCQYALRRFIFSKALTFFLELLRDEINQQDPVLLLQAGRCSKGAGDWEEALGYLERASRLKREDSSILSELADVNALLEDFRAAKVLFREAFFLDSQGVDLWSLESEMIISLRNRVRDKGYTGNELAEWIPVWGCLEGVFSVKRELKPVELGRLKQSILSLENEHRSKGGDSTLLKPKLLNRYFWLIDHCENNLGTPGMKGLIDDTMRKIKIIDSVIYDRYNKQ